ncbi:MAG TPA: penicillin-binding transpeptidase domain-containing protein [Chitinophagaceae bacterium]|nr:penicillin-binding transpeptidase domain-containing protein [Chitinophagaceae bacterium]
MRFIAFLSLCVLALAACSPNNVKQDKSLEKYFTENNVTGCFALMDNGTGEFTVYNLGRYRDSSYLPASTFKIVSSLIGLQFGVISSDTMMIKWDGIERSVAAWNKDLTMYDAFRVSAVPYYQEVARRIGKDTMQFWLDSLRYGTRKITSAIDTFWLDNSLKITPDEELGLVKRLYFHQLPFYKTYQEKVKNAMIFEDNSNYELAYKTGWGFADSARTKNIGWVVGWVVENKHPYFFVLNIEHDGSGFDMPAVRLKMLKDILRHLGYLEGKM